MRRIIPTQTIKRLPLYLRYLNEILELGKTKVSSSQIAQSLQIKCSLVRKDFSYFGEFGKKGVGYDIKVLISKLKQILNLNREWRVAVCGVGKIGQALMLYPGLNKEGFRIVAAFDNDKEKIGTKIGNLVINDIKDMNKIIKEKRIDIGIISVPVESAREVAEQLVKSGIRAILNFAPCHFELSKKVKVFYVDLTAKLMQLVYYLR